MKAITLCLGFDKMLKEAVNSYVSLFDSVFGNSEILHATHFGEKEIEEPKKVTGMSEEIVPGTAGMVKTIQGVAGGACNVY